MLPLPAAQQADSASQGERLAVPTILAALRSLAYNPHYPARPGTYSPTSGNFYGVTAARTNH